MLPIICAALALFSSLALAQTTTPTGTIRGWVLDSSEAGVAGVRVTARNQQTQAVRVAQTDANGQFYISNLPIGTYTLHTEAAGFSEVSVTPFLLSVGQVIEQRITLQPAGITEKIEVTDRSEGIDAAAATASAALGYERIEEAPARSRNYLNFVLAAPAVAPSAGTSSQRSMTGVRTPLGDSGFTFGGMRARNNAILIDGMDNRDETTGGNRVAVGLEMVQEFRVAGTAIGAELGGAAGGLLNKVTRSGVNLWHGDVTFFAQHERFNARKPEVDLPYTPRFRRIQPGVSFLGPLRRDRTFIAAAVEHESEQAEEWSDVPASAVSVINQALLSPSFDRAAVNSALRGLYDTSTRGTEFSSKLNHQPGAKDTLWARYAFSRGRLRHEVQGPDNFADRSAQGSSLTTDHSLVGDWLRVASPAVVNDLRVQVADRSMSLRPNAFGAMLEIPGVATLGEFYRMNGDRTERHYQLVENFNVVSRGHRLSFGADAHLVRLEAALRTRFAGLFVFPSLEDFIAQRPDVFIQAFGDPHTDMTTVPVGLWIQDRWEPRPGLHLEIGMRYDRQRMPAGLPASSNNFSPRIGAAWRPVRTIPFVLRAGFGLFFDRYPLAYINDALQKDGSRAIEQYAAGADAALAFSVARGGSLLSPLPGVPYSEYRASTEFPSSYGRKFTLGLEQALGKDTSLSIEAIHIRGFHLPRVRNARGTLPPLYLLEQAARSDYLGASVSINRKLNRELAYLVSYTVGRTRDDGSDFDEHPSDPFNAFGDWALSRQHQRHRLAASALFELPLEGRAWIPEWLKEALEDVSFAPIYTAGSGRPINTLLTSDIRRTGAYPISARPPGMPRNAFMTRSTVSLDLRVMKTFRLMNDRAFLQFGIESFNLSNRANTERVSQYFATPAGSRLSNYALTLESLPARQVQFLVQFEY